MRRRAERRLGGLPVSELARIPVGRVVLRGHLEIPRDAKGPVLFAHGSGSSRNSPRNQFVASVLRGTGSGALLFDLLTQDEEREEAFTAPTIARATYDQIGYAVDDVVAVIVPKVFYGVGKWFEDFSQTTDEEVRELLAQADQRVQSVSL